jgi:predicted transcriptional regulator of viral defense system
MTLKSPIRISRVKYARETESRIIEALQQDGRKVFAPQDLAKLFDLHREDWSLLAGVTLDQFILYLETNFGFRKVILSGPTHQKSFTRYLGQNPSPLEVASSLRASAYLCHASAVLVHGLTEQLPKVLYVNYEQSVKPRPTGALTQESMDRAFRGRQRESTFAFLYEDYTLILLSGKNTKRLEVQTKRLPEGGKVDVTSLERTLIDIAVRPNYAGGVHQVLDAYRAAKPLLSVGKLLSTLKQLDYIYPYHQAIGFYLERAGYPEKQWSRLHQLGAEFNFYLTHGMKEMDFDARWRLFHPKGL